jgi:flagellar biosynthesis protein
LSSHTDKTRERAVALRYERDGDRAPQVVAKGSGSIARRIIEEARKHGLPMREDPLLVEALSGLDLYQEIPEELYQVIAEIYAFLYRVRNEALSSRETPTAAGATR